MKLKPLLVVAGACGAAAAAAAVVKRRGAAKAVQGGGEEPPHERYEPPIEALAQEPRTPGDRPSSAARVLPPNEVEAIPGDALNEPEHGPPEGSVMPDTSDDDQLVREQEKAAEGDAGSIGRSAGEPAADGEAFESFEDREDVERSNREIEP
jgi:hypothetical protein